MLENEMKDKLTQLNLILQEREKTRPPKIELRNKLSKLGTFIKLNKMTNEELNILSNGKGIVGVDGSYTTVGNTYPNILFLAQALAKSTNDTLTEGVKDAQVFTDLITGKVDIEREDTSPTRLFSKKVTKMEIKVATIALEQYSPFITMFDGGFWRLLKDSEEEWENFRKLSLAKNSLVVGVIEDAGSYDLWEQKEINLGYFTTDSDILFGLLEKGEIFLLNNSYRGDFIKAFARFSNDPLPIACDFLPEHKDYIIKILRLIYRLTPDDGRGIPLWIDIVDNEVKLTKEKTELLIDAYIDKTLKERLFIGKRNRR